MARFATNLGPVAWNIASKKIESCLPAGVNYGPGWVGGNDVPAQRPLSLPSLSLPSGQQISSQPCSVCQNLGSAATSDALKTREGKQSDKPDALKTREDKQSEKPEADNLSKKHVPSVHSISGSPSSKSIPVSGTTSSSLLAAKRSPESQNVKTEATKSSCTGFNTTNSSAGAITLSPSLQTHQSPLIRHGMNGYSGAYGFNQRAQMVKLIGAARPHGFSFQSSQMLDTVSKTAPKFVHPATSNSNSDDPKFSGNSSTKNPSNEFPNSGCEALAAPTSGLHPHAWWQGLPLHEKSVSRSSPKQKQDSVPPDLSVRFQPSVSRSSGRVDSSQPDLTLQL